MDGVFESNTYYLERFCGWRGLLVEPVPEMYQRIRTNRPAATAVNCALVPFGYGQTTVPIFPAHAMSRVGHPSDHPAVAGRPVQPIDVPARRLSELLDEIGSPVVDLLSLDVEGFEIEALKGLDFRRHRPRSILVECVDEQSKAAMDQFLAAHYRYVEAFTYRDYLYQLL